MSATVFDETNTRGENIEVLDPRDARIKELEETLKERNLKIIKLKGKVTKAKEQNEKQLKDIDELKNENKKLKKENEDYERTTLIKFDEEWFDLDDKKERAWTEYVMDYPWGQEMHIRREEFEEEYEEEDSDDEDSDDEDSNEDYICDECKKLNEID